MANLFRTQSEASGSLGSDASNPIPPEALQELEDEALLQLIRQTEEMNKTMKKEVEMFEKFLKRLDPKDAQLKPAVSTQLEDKRRGTRQKAGLHVERLLKLSVEQKCDIATRELDELREEMVKKREEKEKVLDHHRAVLMGADHRLVEMNKAVYEFDRDIIRGAVNARTGKIQGERVLKYFEDYKRSRDNLIEKLRLKNSTMRIKKQKLQAHLKQKEEAGEVRHEVDFEQLKIENEQLRDRLEEKNHELLKLKLSSGNSTQVLNSYKQKVQGLSSQSRKVEAEIHQREELLKKIDREFDQSVQEKEKAEEAYGVSKRMLEDFTVPDVMDYVKETAGQYELIKTLRTWERKVEIAEMTLRTHKQSWQQLCKQLEKQRVQKKGIGQWSSPTLVYTK